MFNTSAKTDSSVKLFRFSTVCSFSLENDTSDTSDINVNKQRYY